MFDIAYSSQPGGFEGLLLGRKHRQACDLPSVNVVEKRVGGLDFNPASLAPPVLHAEDEDTATQVTHLCDLLTPFIPGSHPSGDDRVQLLASLAFAAVRSGPGSIDDHVRIEVGQRRVSVSGVEGVVHLAEDLHVLLRHRLLPQPGGCEGCDMVPNQVRAWTHFPLRHVWMKATP